MARHNPQRGAGGVDTLMLGLPLFLTDTGVEFTVTVIDKASWPFIVINLARRR